MHDTREIDRRYVYIRERDNRRVRYGQADRHRSAAIGLTGPTRAQGHHVLRGVACEVSNKHKNKDNQNNTRPKVT